MSTSFGPWRFFRAGGFDQVRLDTAAELLHMGSLDQKLWVALSCPVKGIEFDTKTLALIDSDADGHVRSPELIAAVQWAGERLRDVDVLVSHLPGVPVHAIRSDDESGQRIAEAAQALLKELGTTDGMVRVEDASLAQERFTALAVAQWEADGVAARLLGDDTESAYLALEDVREKINDYFVRCHLTAFDDRARDALNATVDAFNALASSTLHGNSEAIAALPIARVDAHAPLPLGTGANPAWAGRLQSLKDKVVRPLLGEMESLTEADWQVLQQKMQGFAVWRTGKPDASAQAEGAQDLEKLARYVRDLQSLANNFVAFRDFYTRNAPATFQVGTLFLDGRSCDLCVAVNDAGKHSALASLSRIFLAYVECVRGAEKMTVAAAFTAGDSDQLMVGRNGVFYDRQGRDWDATITRIVDHPISLRQAFWSPYKAFARAVGNVVQKMAASKSAEADGRLTAAAGDGVKKLTAPGAAKSAPNAVVAPFDVAKFAGIFAAIGLAVGAIGTMVASVVAGLFALLWWQWPLAVAGMMALISGPAVALAWFKLRSRNLGPILDANGWAINSRARINIPFGTSLTQIATLPEGAERAMVDPYADKNNRGAWIVATGVALGLALAWKAGLIS